MLAGQRAKSKTIMMTLDPQSGTKALRLYGPSIRSGTKASRLYGPKYRGARMQPLTRGPEADETKTMTVTLTHCV
jgi:hypothetical protein